MSACAALRRVAQECPRERLAIHAHQRHPAPGNVSDFDSIYDGVFPQLFRYCHRLTGDADQAEDVAQEAFFRLLTRNVDGPPAALRVWLFKVATHIVRDQYRVSENRRRLLEKHPPTPDGPADPEREMSRLEDAALVRAALQTLSERDRQMLLMREEGFSYKEIADTVEVRVTSVGTLLARAQQRLAAALDLHGPRRADTEKGM